MEAAVELATLTSLLDLDEFEASRFGHITKNRAICRLDPAQSWHRMGSGHQGYISDTVLPA